MIKLPPVKYWMRNVEFLKIQRRIPGIATDNWIILFLQDHLNSLVLFILDK